MALIGFGGIGFAASDSFGSCLVLGEAHQIGEQNAHALEAVGDHGFAP
jgi:hypothetical protein